MADPERIGRYLVQGALGSGSFATVFLALDELLDQQVAIKVLADNWARNADTRRRFIEEAKILRRVDHDRVVRVHTVDELPDGRPYFVMTYADRGTLEARLAARRLERRPFQLGEAVAIVTEIGECLSVIHELGVVHRDLKPSNVLLRTGRGPRGAAPVERIVLGDFGLAKDLAAASGFTLAAGTPAYMAPEQASLSDELDHRADLFALTAVLFELLTGRPPFAAVTMSDVRRAHERHHQPLLVEVRPELPAALQAVIDKGLQVAPSERHQSAEELVGELAAAAGAAPAGTAGAALAGTAAEGPVGQARAASALEAELRGLFEALRAAAQSEGDRAVVQQACARLEGPVRVLVLAGADAPWPGPAAALVGLDAGQLPDVAPTPGLRWLVWGGAPQAQLGGAPAASPAAGVWTLRGPAAGLDLSVWLPVGALAGAAVAELPAAVEGPLGPQAAELVRAADVVVTAGDPAAAAAAARAGRAGPVLVVGLADPACAELLAACLGPRRAEVAASAAAALLAQGEGATAAFAQLAAGELERVGLGAPTLAEAAVLRDDAAGRLVLAAPLRAELRRLLLGADPAARLGLPPDAPAAGVAAAAAAALERWRTWVNTGRAPFAARGAAGVVIRSLERLCAEAG